MEQKSHCMQQNFYQRCTFARFSETSCLTSSIVLSRFSIVLSRIFYCFIPFSRISYSFIPFPQVYCPLTLFVTLCLSEKWKRFQFILNLELGLKRASLNFSCIPQALRINSVLLYSSKSVN